MSVIQVNTIAVGRAHNTPSAIQLFDVAFDKGVAHMKAVGI